MKTVVSLVVAGLCVWSAATAQISPHFSSLETGLVSQDELPSLETLNELTPSGETNNAWYPNFKTYVRENVRYPGAARDAGLEGVVHAEAIVKADGKLTDIQIVEGLSYICDKEVVRLLSGMLACNPARHDGRPSEQKVYLRVRFMLKPF